MTGVLEVVSVSFAFSTVTTPTRCLFGAGVVSGIKRKKWFLGENESEVKVNLGHHQK
jgi:hypothetical protein